MPDSTAEVLLEQTSPNGNIAAIVESNGSSVYFYLFGSRDIPFGMRSCWVRNLLPAPSQLEVDSMATKGSPPLLPAPYCAHRDGAPAPRSTELSVVWFEQGDAAALLEGDQILAIIPAWSGVNGFDGYARDCIAESPIARPLRNPDTNVLFARVERARNYWSSWDDNPWPAYADAQIKAYQSALGEYTKYFAIDGGNWPPKAMLRYDRSDAVIFTTVGISLRPMPRVEMNVKDPTQVQRVELAMAIDPRLADALALQQLGQYISGQSSLPWRQYTFFDEGHTLPCDSIPVGHSGNAFTSILFTRVPKGAPRFGLPNYRDGLVTTLWMLPITDRELLVAKELGSAKLSEMLGDAGFGYIHRDRRQVS
jgi:hypothetical protein